MNLFRDKPPNQSQQHLNWNCNRNEVLVACGAFQ